MKERDMGPVTGLVNSLRLEGSATLRKTNVREEPAEVPVSLKARV